MVNQVTSFITSLPVEKAIQYGVIGSAGEFVFKKFIKPYSKIDMSLFRWIDYPQSLMAAVVAFSILDPKRKNIASCLCLVALPLVFKTMRLIVSKKTIPHQIVEGGDHLIRLVSKAILLGSSISHLIAQHSPSHLMTSCFLSFHFLLDAYIVSRYATSKIDDFHGLSKGAFLLIPVKALKTIFQVSKSS